MNEQERLDNLLDSAFRAHEPHPSLKAKLLKKSPSQSTRTLWFGVGATALAASLAALVFMPQPSLAESLAKQMKGYRGHVTSYMILPNGRWKRTGDEWVDDGKNRVRDTDDGRYEMLQDHSKGFWIVWNGQNGTAIFRPAHEGGGNPLPGIVDAENLRNFLSNQNYRNKPTTEKTTFKGQPCDCIVIQPQNTITKIYADSQTHRLLGWSYRNLKVWPENPPSNNYEKVYVVDNDPLPPKIFEPVFDIFGTPTNLVQKRSVWQEKLSHPLTTITTHLTRRMNVQPVPETQKIAIRSVTQNSSGDLFVLFTGVHGPFGYNIVPSVVHDSANGRYIKGIGFQPCDQNGGLSYDGKPLEGAWFIHVSGSAVRGPVSIGFKQEFDSIDHQAFTYTVRAEQISSKVPSYMPFMAMPVGTPHNWLKQRAFMLADDREKAKDYIAEERYRRESIELSKPEELEGGWDDPGNFMRLARCLEHQGKKQPAYAMFQKASEALAKVPADFPDNYAKEQIKAGLIRLRPNS